MERLLGYLYTDRLSEEGSKPFMLVWLSNGHQTWKRHHAYSTGDTAVGRGHADYA